MIKEKRVRLKTLMIARHTGSAEAAVCSCMIYKSVKSDLVIIIF